MVKTSPKNPVKKLLGSIFPENFDYDGIKYRTAKTKSVFAGLCRLDAAFKKNSPVV
jgi:hypothetical protein